MAKIRRKPLRGDVSKKSGKPDLVKKSEKADVNMKPSEGVRKRRQRRGKKKQSKVGSVPNTGTVQAANGSAEGSVPNPGIVQAANGSAGPNDDMLVDTVNEVFRETKESNTTRKKKRKRKKPASVASKKAAISRKHAQERAEFDARMRLEPHRILWEEYVKWAGERLSTVEKSNEEWNSEQVQCLNDPGEGKLIDVVKGVVGADYATRTNFDLAKHQTPAVACLMLALTTAGVLTFAQRLYDGKPVAKLFSRHTRIADQSQFLAKACEQGILPTAAGTVFRVENLLDQGNLTLDFLQVLLVDMSRDQKLFDMMDFPYCDKFFDLIHRFIRSRIASNEMKVILVVPTEDKMPKEINWDLKKTGEEKEISKENDADAMEEGN